MVERKIGMGAPGIEPMQPLDDTQLLWPDFSCFAGVLMVCAKTPLAHSTTLRSQAGGQTVVTAQQLCRPTNSGSHSREPLEKRCKSWGVRHARAILPTSLNTGPNMGSRVLTNRLLVEFKKLKTVWRQPATPPAHTASAYLPASWDAVPPSRSQSLST